MGVAEGHAQTARESFWKGRSMRDVPAGLRPGPGRKTALILGSALVSSPPGSFPGCPAGIFNNSEAPGAHPGSSWRTGGYAEAGGTWV